MSSKLDITSTVIEKSIDSVKGFLNKLIGPAIEETGLLIADPIRLWRFKNQISILEKAQKIVKEKNIDTKIISVKTLVPFLEYSSLEEDENLQDMWTNLFVNYVDARQKHESSVYPYILNQLSTDDIMQLNQFNEKISIKRDFLEASDTVIANLIRLGLIRHSTGGGEGFRMFFSPSIHYGMFDSFHLTSLGKEFIECCSSKE